jgi:ureidoacrylate peracid hydrolase
MKTALVLVDLQNAFCRPDGSYARRGFEIPGLDRVIDACTRLLEESRKRGWDVVFTRLVFHPDYSDGGLLVADQPQIRALSAYRNGGDDCRIIEEIAPRPGDLLIDKNRYDPFVNTGLEAELRARGITDLVVGGLLTNVCVESTVRSAYDRDFRVTVLSDASASYDPGLHQAALATMGRHFARVCRLEDLLRS